MEGLAMRILATGTDGYIGTVLPEILMEHGHDVTGVDTGFHKAGWLYNGVHASAETLAKDIRDLTVEDLRRVRRRRPPRRALERPGGATGAAHHLRDQPPRLGEAGFPGA